MDLPKSKIDNKITESEKTSQNDQVNSVVVNFTDVQLAYSKQVVLRDINLRIFKSEFVYVIGRTGAGKSTLLKSIFADAEIISGSLMVDKYEIRNIKPSQVPFLRRRLGIVFQDYQLLTDRTVGENLMFVMKATGWTDSKRMKEHMNEVMMKVGLASKINFMPHQLSGGEQQRAAIARAIVNDPLLIVADEPTGNLDPDVSGQIMELFLKINQAGTAVIMATHDYDTIKKFPARTLECIDYNVKTKTIS